MHIKPHLKCPYFTLVWLLSYSAIVPSSSQRFAILVLSWIISQSTTTLDMAIATATKTKTNQGVYEGRRLRSSPLSDNLTRRDFEDLPLSSSQPSHHTFYGTQVTTHHAFNGATSHTNPVVSFPRANEHPGDPSWSVSMASLPQHARHPDPHNQLYGHALGSTTTPLTLESVHVHGHNLQGYHGVPVSHESVSTSFHPQQQMNLRRPIHPLFTPGSKTAPTTHAHGVVDTPNHGQTLSRPVYAQPHTPLVPISQPTAPFSTITASPSPIIPPSVATANVDGGSGNFHVSPSSVRGADAATSNTLPVLTVLEEMDEDPPPISPPAAPYPQLRKPRAQGSKFRKIMDDVPLEKDVSKLQQRLTAQGGDKDAIARVPIVFANGISKSALKLRRRKTGSMKSMGFDQGYMNFVGRRQVKKGNNEMGVYYENEWWCRLCPPEDRIFYVAFKNLQPHLCSKHFGLPGRGTTSGVSTYNTCNQL